MHDEGDSEPSRETPRATSQAVVGGSVDTTRPDVLFVQDDTAAGFRCTATLIAPNLVITARHCVGKRSTGTTPCKGGATNEGAQSLPNYQGNVEAAPMYFSAAPGAPLLARGKTIFDDGATTTCAHDLALIELDRSIAGITPSELRRAVLIAGEPLVAMGFGWTDRNASVNATQRMKGNTTALALGPTVHSFKPFGDASMASQPLAIAAGEVGVGGITMTGDGGGPAFDATGRIAALVSRGYGDAYCGPGTFTTLAAHLATIDAALAATGNAPPAIADGGTDAAPVPPAKDAGIADSGPGTTTGDDDAGTAETTDAPTTSDGGCQVGLHHRNTRAASVFGLVLLASLGLIARLRRRAAPRAPRRAPAGRPKTSPASG